MEVQYFDGNLDEIELSLWHQMDLESIEEPENWSGALDIAEVDDLGTSVTDTSPDDWQEPLQDIKRADGKNPPESLEPLLDDWGEGFPQEESWEEEQ